MRQYSLLMHYKSFHRNSYTKRGEKKEEEVFTGTEEWKNYGVDASLRIQQKGQEFFYLFIFSFFHYYVCIQLLL